MELWTRITNGRRAFGDYLATLDDADWAHRSQCADWTVKDTAAHMLVIPTMSRGAVFGAFLGSGFNLDKMNAKFVAKLGSSMSNAEVAATTRSSAESRSVPPGLKVPGVLTELAVHAGDISEAVGKPFALPTDDYVAVLDHLKNVQPVFGTKKRIAGLTMRATDASWSHGSGPVVEGPARYLAAALANRPAALEHLSGDGLATLRSR